VKLHKPQTQECYGLENKKLKQLSEFLKNFYFTFFNIFAEVFILFSFSIKKSLRKVSNIVCRTTEANALIQCVKKHVN